MHGPVLAVWPKFVLYDIRRCFLLGPLFYAITGVTVVILAVAAFFVGSAVQKNKDRTAVGSAEDEARRILSDAMKNAQARKKEALIEAKEEIHRHKGHRSFRKTSFSRNTFNRF